LGSIHGLLYIFIIPPWQHYDEPNHFEYSWLIADRGKLPAPDDYDLPMRRLVARSMIENDFFRGMGFLPDLSSDTQPAWIGPISQLTNPPLYYLITSLAVRATIQQEIRVQMVAVRLVSLLFYLICIWAAWGVISDVAPRNDVLRVMVPATIALLPGFADAMTAVNNDAITVALVSLCFWCCVRLVQRGFAPVVFVCGAAAALLSLFAKETGVIAVPLFLAALMLSVFRCQRRWIAWGVIGLGLLGLGASALSWGDAAGWYRSSSQTSDSRIANTSAVLGRHVFTVDASAQVTPDWVAPFFQPVIAAPPSDGAARTFTLGGWVWADQSTSASTPTLADGYEIHNQVVQIDSIPRFFAFTTGIDPERGLRLWVNLDPNPGAADAKVFYDGLVLVEGDFPSNISPEFEDLDGEQGVWAGAAFHNLLRNASAEKAGIRIAAWVDHLGARLLPDQSRPSLLVSYALDWQGAGWSYRLNLERLLRTFWATFGWGQVHLLGHHPYRWLAFATILGILGSGFWIARRCASPQKDLSWDVIFLFGLLLVGSWGSTLVRAAVFLGSLRLYIPVARYAYPAIIPTISVLCLGWLELFRSIGQGLKLRRYSSKTFLAGWILVWIGLDIYSLVSIRSFYG
jgi:hypothetical protein